MQYDRSRPIGLLKIAGMKVDLEDLLHCEVDLVEDGTLRPWAVYAVGDIAEITGLTAEEIEAL